MTRALVLRLIPAGAANAGAFELVRDAGEADMTSESTVSQFVNETLRGFPSTRTAFTLWSPGGGGGFLGVGGDDASAWGNGNGTGGSGDGDEYEWARLAALGALKRGVAAGLVAAGKAGPP